MRIGEAERFERPVPERLAAALGHDFDRQAALEIRGRYPFVERKCFAGDQRVGERLVLVAVERTIDVIGAGAARTALVVARLEPGDREIDGLSVRDRRDRVEEGERLLPGDLLDGA